MSLPECNKEALPELPEYKKRMAPNPTGALTKNVNNNFRRISFILRKVWSYRTDAKPLRKIRHCLNANVDPAMWSTVTAVVTICTSMAVSISERFSARVSAPSFTTSFALSAARATAATPLDTAAEFVRHRSPYLQQKL